MCGGTFPCHHLMSTISMINGRISSTHRACLLLSGSLPFLLISNHRIAERMFHCVDVGSNFITFWQWQHENTLSKVSGSNTLMLCVCVGVKGCSILGGHNISPIYSFLAVSRCAFVLACLMSCDLLWLVSQPLTPSSCSSQSFSQSKVSLGTKAKWSKQECSAQMQVYACHLQSKANMQNVNYYISCLLQSLEPHWHTHSAIVTL